MEEMELRPAPFPSRDVFLWPRATDRPTLKHHVCPSGVPGGGCRTLAGSAGLQFILCSSFPFEVCGFCPISVM